MRALPAGKRTVPNQAQATMRELNRQEYLRYSTVGLEYAVTFGVGLAAGYGVDLLAGTVPGFTVIGGVVGFLLGTRRLARQGKALSKYQMEQELQEARRRRKEQKGDRGLDELRELMYREKEGRQGQTGPGAPAAGEGGEPTATDGD